MKRKLRFILYGLLILVLAFPYNAFAAVDSYEALLDALANSTDGEVIIVSGVITGEQSAQPLSSNVSVTIRAQEGMQAELLGITIDSLDAAFSNVYFANGLKIGGDSQVQLMNGTKVTAKSGEVAIAFVGTGSLTIGKGVSVKGGDAPNKTAGDGVYIEQRGSGDVHAVLDGEISGGTGKKGGNALTLSGLKGNSSVNVNGTVSGGKGDSMGGNAANLYDLTDEARVNVSGQLLGGSGHAGGNAAQIINVASASNVSITGTAQGGDGDAYGGDTLIAMNVSGTLTLSGTLRGGNVLESGDRPGVALLLMDSSTSNHTHKADAQIEDGQIVSAQIATPAPTVTVQPTLVPSITSSVDQVHEMTPEPVPTDMQDETEEPIPAESLAPPVPDHDTDATTDEATADEAENGDVTAAETNTKSTTSGQAPTN